MELDKIFALLERFDASGLSALELEEGNLRLRLEKGVAPVIAAPAAPAAPAPVQAAPAPTPAAPAAVPVAVEEGTLIRAPLVGTFYAAPAPDRPPFVKVGDKVKQGQTVCVLEAMKMMSEIPAPCDGEILEVLAEDGALVSFDAPLFRVRELASC